MDAPVVWVRLGAVLLVVVLDRGNRPSGAFAGGCSAATALDGDAHLAALALADVGDGEGCAGAGADQGAVETGDVEVRAQDPEHVCPVGEEVREGEQEVAGAVDLTGKVERVVCRGRLRRRRDGCCGLGRGGADAKTVLTIAGRMIVRTVFP